MGGALSSLSSGLGSAASSVGSAVGSAASSIGSAASSAIQGLTSANTIGGATQGLTLGQKIGTGIQMGSQLLQLGAPKGALASGDMGGIFNLGKGLYDNFNKLTASPETIKNNIMKQYGITSTAPSPSVQGSPEILGRGTNVSFASMTPSVQKEIMKILLGKK